MEDTRRAGAGAARRFIIGGVAALLTVFGSGVSPAAANARISGTVVNGTHKKAVAGQEISLNLFRANSPFGGKTATTDKNGAFAFDGLEPGAPWTYGLATTYRGADYPVSNLSLTAGESKTVKITVYDATESAADIKVSDWTVWIDRQGGVAVQQDLEIQNSGNKTYVGDEPIPPDKDGQMPPGKRAVTRLPLAPGAREFQYVGIFMECCPLSRGDTFIHTMAIAPGTSRGTLRYTTPSVSTLSFPAAFPTDRLSLLVPKGMRPTSAQLQPAGQTQDRGVTYDVYVAQKLAKGTTLDVALAGAASGGVPAAAFALFGIAALAAVAFAILRMRARGGAGTGEARRAHAGAASGARHVSAAASPAATETEDAKLLIDEIAALDLAFERGMMPEDSYRRIRAARKARLLELLGDRKEETGSPAR